LAIWPVYENTSQGGELVIISSQIYWNDIIMATARKVVCQVGHHPFWDTGKVHMSGINKTLIMNSLVILYDGPDQEVS
jgi:hypothetical protein